MFLSKVAARLSLVSRLSGTLHHQSQSLSCTLGRFRPARCQSFSITHRHLNSAADNNLPPKLWMPLEPELEEVLVPRRGGQRSLSCKNVLEIRRRKMNRHQYKKLLKRTKFLRRRVKEGRLKRKQSRFEKDLTRIWKKAGLKKAPEGWTMPKIFTKQY
ncbi:hypothetical protein AALO_G00053630 [Alosa alosa]|uniref:Small ribosomal subunit protein mS38 n=1 Tax=Alosa alosa TaxID=278164 RepID=A0AAV6H892_9TELE|nr:hypothetical protein AALO_G00053630 [Alosa alosa]